MKTINQLIRPELKAFKPYIPSPTLEELASKVNVPVEKFLKLNSGENLFVDQPYWLYPDPQANDLRQELTKYIGLPKDYIMAGNGSDELIDLITRFFISPRDEVIDLPPTFLMYTFYARLNGAKVANLPRTKTFGIDVDQIIKAASPKTKLIFICNPNNPTGTLIPKSNILRLVKALPYCLVVVDEAYFEYCSQTVAPDVKKYPNLIVLRSLSKWAGLAGLRLGYALANPEIIQALYSIKSPYNVNSMAQQEGVNALKNKLRLLSKLKNIIKGRQFLINQLSQLPDIQVFPSQGAYVLFQLKTRSASTLQTYLRSKGIEVKVIDQAPLDNCVRVNIIPPGIAKRLVKLIQEFVQIDAVIFDMDGVLIDVSQSYRQTILQTANIFLKQSKKQTITQKDIVAVKDIPGFNNDWDVTYALVTSSLKPPTQKQRQTKLYQQIKSTFQKIYLGNNINNETPLINKRTLSLLKQQGFKLGIATSRPRSEAVFTLRQNKLTRFFSPRSLIAQEDTAKEKPNPQPLLEACRRLKAQNPIYIGDSINDALAAKAANMPCIFIDKNNDVNQALKILL